MIKIGVVGVGHLGKIHLRLLKEVELFQLVGFYDSNELVRKNVSDEFNIRSFDTVEELIEQVDAVDIVTPTIYHFEYAKLALKKSKHLFIEKPVTATIDEGKSLLRIALEANVKVQVGHVERFNPAFLAASAYCTEPMFIETHRLAQFNPRGTDVSVVLDLMIHDIDVVLSIVKSNIRRISASGVAVVSDTPDIANARIEFDNGCVANLTASRISLKNMRKSRFFQRDAYISVDFLDKEVSIVKLKNVSKNEIDPLSITIDLGNEKGKKQIYFESPKIEAINSIKEELSHFALSIANNTTPPVTLHDGVNALRVAIQIIEKLKVTAHSAEE
ncbi:MAG: Gfo/Idh/MocA family oxidoreductase [Bacteroidetes bacterium]|nr:gfo/Idh/MocA family oxidoreductase [Bacteroidota bacterium]MBV6461419.1 scyllo-inositol 2-dehydrogenase (NAD(+)) [Flavobacteriales bacterium]WKZ76583.1 MAG: Gfo/Idh/MocA family oxidoreductase [Vicingaceae bacterium]MCL4815596.1 Gfo/Idh/MocA family oxidoreductase [Flavobacteriales bacterium]NOG94266.1 Gfo/Idh/MocA family oxidoreductase [Bacteroidota bacterium]